MSVQDALKAAGFESALIIDDAFDEFPAAADLAMDADSWSIFVDDIGTDAEHIEAAFPGFADTDAKALRESDEFVRTVYGLKDKLRPELWNTLFESYERDRASDRGFLESLKTRLAEAGLRVVTAGRAVPEEGRECRIVFADLFLGASQQDFDIEESIKRLRKLVAGREASPPAVVLMSRSPRLQDKRERFRDDAKLVGALFRVYRKHDLLEGSTIETLLERFASHYADAVRVAAFLTAWEAGLVGASAEFMKLMRRLDLSDYSKIREVLLDVEGQPLGSYMLDVFDRVLQHQIEGQTPTIAAAQELNQIDPANYPAPYIAGSPDLQDLVARVLWQHLERLKVTGNTAGMPISFGDVLILRSKLDPTKVAQAPVGQPDVLIVLTPACDLVRKPDKRRVLLVGGALKPIDSKTWRYKTKGVSTSILQLPSQARMFIEWDLDDQRMLNREELLALTATDGLYEVRVRLRESNALELQQRLLSDLGRVGLLSNMPFTFPVDVLFFTVDTDGTPEQLDLPVIASEGGVCISGRDANGNDHTRLVLTESAVDEILRAIPKIEEAQINARARDTLKRLQESVSFRSLLQRGLRAPQAIAKGNLTPLKVPVKVPADKVDGEQVADEEIVGLIVRNPGQMAALSGIDLKNGAFIVVLNDLEPLSIVVGEITAAESGEGEEPKNA